MKILLISIVLLVGCEQRQEIQKVNHPPVREVSARVPVELRQGNYGPSCYHAAMITVLKWQGEEKVAVWWRRNGYGPASIGDIRARAKWAGLNYKITTDGDIEFLDWVSETRRAAAIQYQQRHAVTFTGFRNGNAIIIDNRFPSCEVKVPRQQFLRSWRYYGGHAITVVSLPPPPKPWR